MLVLVWEGLNKHATLPAHWSLFEHKSPGMLTLPTCTSSVCCDPWIGSRQVLDTPREEQAPEYESSVATSE